VGLALVLDDRFDLVVLEEAHLDGQRA